VVLQLGANNKMLQRAMDLDRFFRLSYDNGSSILLSSPSDPLETVFNLSVSSLAWSLYLVLDLPNDHLFDIFIFKKSHNSYP